MEGWKNKKLKYYCLMSFYSFLVILIIGHLLVLNDTCFGQVIFDVTCRTASKGVFAGISWLTITDFIFAIIAALIIGLAGLFYAKYKKH